MQAAAVVVAVEVAYLEFDMGECMCAVYHHWHFFLVRHIAYLSHGQYLTRDVHHVADHQQLGLWGNGGCIPVYNFLVVLRVYGQGYGLVYHAIPFGYLPEHIQHGSIVLLSHHGLIALLPVHAADDHIQRLGSIAGDDELISTTACQCSQPCGYHSLIIVLPGAHIACAFQVHLAYVGIVAVHHLGGHNIIIAVFQVYVARFQLVCFAYGFPEIFVLRYFARWVARYLLHHLAQRRKAGQAA